MRSFLLAATLGAAESLAVDVTHKSKKPAVQALMQSATNMLKEGATPEVVDFVEETLREVTGVVLPSIMNESANDQTFIFSLHSRFQVIRDDLVAGNQVVHQANSEEQDQSSIHKACRATEAESCTSKRECEMELHRLWTQWVTEEENLREIHDRIETHFCVQNEHGDYIANGTQHSFRVNSVAPMQHYMSQKELAFFAEQAYDQKRPDCEQTHGALNDQSATCNAAQDHLEGKACMHRASIHEVLTLYYTDFAQASSTYIDAVAEVMQLEKDRKQEWKTLQVVNCLLGRIREQNGVPCDASNGGVTAEVGVCEERHSDDADPSLTLQYPPVLPHPPQCPDRSSVVGECLPVAQPAPCTDAWESAESDPLPLLPQPEFSATNPGCNDYPPCSPCSGHLETPSPVPVPEMPERPVM